MQSLIPAIYDLNVQAGANFTFTFLRRDSAGEVLTFAGYTPHLVAKINLTDTLQDAVFDFSDSPEIFFDDDWTLNINLNGEQTDITDCCLYYSISLVNDTDDTDILSYASGIMNVAVRADTVQ